MNKSASLLAYTFTLALLSACDSGSSPSPQQDQGLEGGVGVEGCAFDEVINYESAPPLVLGEEVEGYLCPVGDQDWYRVSLERPSVLEVSVEIEGGLSPLALYYELYHVEGGEAREVVGALPPQLASLSASASHCLPAGELGLRLSDLGNDAQDKRSPYTLSVRAQPEPDADEAGLAEGLTSARELSLDVAREGALSCLGDEDWFSLEVPPSDAGAQLLSWRLEMPESSRGVSPRLRLLNAEGRQLFEQRRGLSEGGRDLTHTLALTEPGRVFLVVDEASGERADVGATYQLTASLSADIDVNEPNDSPASASALQGGALRCEAEWSAWRELEGSLSVLGDSDWVALELEGCERGLIEAEVSLNDEGLSREASFELQRSLQLSLSLLRPHAPSACEPESPQADLSCRSLNATCERAWDCAGFGAVCGADGLCRAPASCLPSGACAATQVERRFTLPTNATPQALPPHRAKLSAPLLNPEGSYLKVSDVGADAASTEVSYTLRVRVRQEPDLNEPSNLYTDEVRQGDPVAAQVRFAQARPWVYVHECSEGVIAPEPPIDGSMGGQMGGQKLDDMSPPLGGAELLDMGVDVGVEPLDMGADMGVEPLDMGADMGVSADMTLDMALEPDQGVEPPPQGELWPSCCESDQALWTEGVLSYEDDQDFYTYAHPCPGEDCMVKIYYEIDEGPVDMLWQVYQGESLWFDPIVPVSELQVNSAQRGSFGGLAEGDQCFYAWQGHMSTEERPFLYTLAIRDLRPTRDWSSEQRYRFCVEKVGQGCFEPPCEVAEEPTDPERVGGCQVPRR